MPKVIKDIVDKVFIGNMSIGFYKSQYNPEILERHNETDESAKEFYQTKKAKEKDAGLSL